MHAKAKRLTAVHLNAFPPATPGTTRRVFSCRREGVLVVSALESSVQGRIRGTPFLRRFCPPFISQTGLLAPVVLTRPPRRLPPL